MGGQSGSSAERHDTQNIAVLLRQVETFSGVCLVASNRVTGIDEAFLRRFTFSLEFHPPDLAQREKLWKALLPPEAPCDSNVDFRAISGRFELTGGQIKSALVRAATRAALRSGDDQIIRHKDLEESASEETRKGETGRGAVPSNMYA